MLNTNILCCNFDDLSHQTAFIELMNAYINDDMGGGEPFEGERAEQLIAGLQQMPNSLVLFAKTEKKYIGLCNAFINFATFSVKKSINIHDVIVLREYRGLGIGRKLLEAVIRFAKEINCSKVTLEVREDNRVAQQLYKGIGFDECKPRMLFWTKLL